MKNTKTAAAIDLLNNNGIGDVSFIGHSDTNGNSYYFMVGGLDGVKVRFSDHSISNAVRMEKEVCFYFNGDDKANERAICQLKFKLGFSGYGYGKLPYKFTTSTGKQVDIFGYMKF